MYFCIRKNEILDKKEAKIVEVGFVVAVYGGGRKTRFSLFFLSHVLCNVPDSVGLSVDPST